MREQVTFPNLNLEMTMKVPTRTVTIPACDEHEGYHSLRVTLLWVCPICGGPRGEPHPALSYDGSRRLNVDGWTNPCGHVDGYATVRQEAKSFPSPERLSP